MKVRIAFATLPNGDVDVKRIDSIEDHPDGDAKELIKNFIAAKATEQEIRDWESSQARSKLIAETEAATPQPEEFDLNSLTIEQLRNDYPAAAEQPANTRKADLIAAVEAAQNEPADSSEDGDAGVNQADGGSTIVTVAPGAESSPDVDPADRD